MEFERTFPGALWEESGRAHAEVFGEHPPRTKLAGIHVLIAPDMLIEVEADAVVGP